MWSMANGETAEWNCDTSFRVVEEDLLSVICLQLAKGEIMAIIISFNYIHDFAALRMRGPLPPTCTCQSRQEEERTFR